MLRRNMPKFKLASIITALTGLVILAVAGVAQAADTGVVFPDNVESSDWAITGSATSPTNALTDNGTRAIAHAGSNGTSTAYSTNGDSAVFSFPTFNIPAGSAINGIEVFFDGQSASKADPNEVRWSGNVSTDAGATWGTEHPANALPLSPCTPIGAASDACDQTLGTPTDLWGLAWTAGDFDATGDFRLRIKAQVQSNATSPEESLAGIDSVSVKVYFTAPYTVTVNKDWTNINGPAVNVTLACTGGTITPSATLPANDGSPAVFTVSGYTGGSTTCTVSEQTLVGITSSDDCGDPFTLGTTDPLTYSCTVSNTAPSACAGLTLSNIVLGTTGDDPNLQGTDAGDLILADSGNDTIYGNASRDCIIGGPGNDTMYGESGSDVLVGGDDYDIAIGGSGTDACEAEQRWSCEIVL